MVSCGMTVIKYLLFVFNLLFAVSGIAILAIGCTILALNSDYQVFGNNFWSIAVLLIIVGGVVFFISFLGCCGAIKNSNVMVKSFAVLLLIIFLLELTIGIAGYVMRNEVNGIVSQSLNTSMIHYNDNASYKDGWLIIQHDFHCCGLQGPTDWKPVFQSDELPPTCCPDIDVQEKCTINSKPYSQGCVDALESAFIAKAMLFGSIGLGVCFIQIVGVILACCLARAFSRDYESV